MKTIDVLNGNGHQPARQTTQSGLQLLPLIMNNIPQAVFWKDRDLVYLGCNQAFADDAGFSSPEEVIGKTDFDMPWKDQAESYRSDDHLVMEKGEPKLNYEEPQTTPDGSTIWLRTSKIPVRENDQVVAVLGMYEDITAHKQTEALLESMIENAPEAIGIIDLVTGLFTDPNENAVKLYELSREELIKVGPAQMSPPFQPDGRSSTEKAMEKINAAMRGEPQVFEWIHRNSRGEDIPCEVRLARLPGSHPRVRFTVTDITTRKQVEQALRDSEARYSAVVTQAKDGVIIIQDNIVQFANKALADMLGYTPDKMVNTPIMDYIARESQALIVNRIKARLAGQEVPSVYEAILQRKDGTTVDAELSAGVIEYRGKPADVGVIRDITERKKAEEAVHASEERFRRFTEATVEGLVFHEHGKVVDVNPAAVKMFGFSDAGELVGRNLLEFIVSESHEFVLKQMQSESVLPYEIQCIRGDGSTFPVETSTRAYKIGDQEIRASSIRDITRRKLLEQQIQTALERRGRQVQLSTQISQSIAAATSLEDLYQRVVTQVKEQFGYYHTQLLRHDAGQNAVVLVTGYGEVGKKMLAAGHRMPMGQGLIGTAAATGEAVLRSTLENDPDWRPNPILPETKGEIAVPIKMGDAILGVLDVQSSVAGALDSDDQLLLEGLCGQIAIAIESTRLRQEMTERLEEINRLYRAMSRDGWQSYRETGNMPLGFVSDQAGLKPVNETPLAEELFANLPLVAPGGEVIGTLAVADDPQRPLSPEEQDFLQQVSEQTALALESARLFEQTQTALYDAKEAEEAVRASEAKLSEALDIAKLANWEYDVARDRFFFNDHFYSIFHTTAEQMGGYELSSAEYAQRLVHPDDVPMVGDAIGKALASTDKHYSTKLEHRVIYADGGIGYISVEVHIDRDDQGNIIRYYGANQDITERKLAEEALRASEAKLSEALDIAKLANWEYDVEHDRFLFNDHFYSIFHTNAEEMGGYELSSAEYAQRLVYPEDLPLVGKEIEKALASTDKHYSAQLEHRIKYVDGGMGYISVEIYIDRDDQGKIIRYYGANQDITERKLAELALRASEARLAEASTLAKLGYWEYSLERDTFTFNDQFYSIFHTTAEKAGGYELSSADYTRLFVYPEDAPLVGKEIERALASTDRHFTAYVEHRIIFPEGGIGYISVNINLERDENGKIIRWYGANQDITERKLAEQAIAKRAAELQTVAEVSTTTAKTLEPDRLLQSVVDLSKNQFGLYHAHIYLIDEEKGNLLLTAGAGEVGQKMVSEGHAIPLNTEKSLVARAVREQQAVIVNDVRSDPGFLPNPLLPETHSEMAVPMIVTDKVLGVFDVQSKHVNAFTREDANIFTTLASQVGVALQNARLYVEQAATVTQLRELDRLKSSFLANMSHELRTPLNSILGFSDVMLDELDGPLTNNMNNDLQLIQKNGQHLLHLINDVLDMAKIEAGRMNLNPERFKVYAVLDEVTSITSTLASEKDLSLFIDETTDQDVEIFADRTRIRQVMINLINNAIKFTEKGKIAIHAIHHEPGKVLITVKDTGIGIPADKLDAIFLEFTQVDTSTTRKAGGTGLGLPISRRLVEMHGGSLWVESSGIPGEGSTFYVELPLEARITEVVEKREASNVVA
ncbi:MAG TPA: PAS domain S-box protein [Anaerolineales bacterium]|nr:PAS domain S-box protein [Anaerolineales bacterium]